AGDGRDDLLAEVLADDGLLASYRDIYSGAAGRSGLPGAIGNDGANDIFARRQVRELVVSSRVGDRARVDRVHDPVEVQIGKDRSPGDAGFGGVTRSVPVDIVEDRAGDRASQSGVANQAQN